MVNLQIDEGVSGGEHRVIKDGYGRGKQLPGCWLRKRLRTTGQTPVVLRASWGGGVVEDGYGRGKRLPGTATGCMPVVRRALWGITVKRRYQRTR